MSLNNLPKYPKIQFITSPSEKYSELETIEECCKGGIKWVQLRMKDTDDTEFEKTALKAQEICKNYNAIFIINDNVALAKKINADGVHLGKKDMHPEEARKILGNNAIIGGTANTFEDIELLEKANVDYIGLGPYKFTQTKKNLSSVLGIQGLKKIKSQCQKENINIPIYAIGGIQSSDFKSISETGIECIAISSAVNQSNNIEAKISAFLQISKKTYNKRH